MKQIAWWITDFHLRSRPNHEMFESGLVITILTGPSLPKDHYISNHLRTQPRHSQQGPRRAAGFAGAAFPFADGGEGDAEHGGEVLLELFHRARAASDLSGDFLD